MAILSLFQVVRQSMKENGSQAPWRAAGNSVRGVESSNGGTPREGPGGGGGGGGYSPKFRIWVCRERSQTLILSKDKKKTKINTLSKAQTRKLTPYSRRGEALRDESNNG